MRSIRVLFLFIAVTGFAATAEACLTCYGSGGFPPHGGTCGESVDGYCSGDCCGAGIGDPCRIPDFYWPCFSPAQPVSLLQIREAPRAPSAYFTSRQPMEHAQRRFVARTRKCAAART